VIRFLYTRYAGQLPKESTERYLGMISDPCKQKMNKYRRWEDQHNCLFGRILILKALNMFGYDFEFLPELKYDKFQRPYIADGIDFNIAHSKNMVVCAMSDEGSIGVDVEFIQEINVDEFSAALNNTELHGVRCAASPVKEFYKIWTRKEAAVKADGRGLSLPLRQINAGSGERVEMDDGSMWVLYQLNISNEYCTHVAVKNQLKEYLRPQFVRI
jgi:4'-phosphopantetheinyl transferase